MRALRPGKSFPEMSLQYQLSEAIAGADAIVSSFHRGGIIEYKHFSKICKRTEARQMPMHIDYIIKRASIKSEIMLK